MANKKYKIKGVKTRTPIKLKKPLRVRGGFMTPAFAPRKVGKALLNEGFNTLLKGRSIPQMEKMAMSALNQAAKGIALKVDNKVMEIISGPGNNLTSKVSAAMPATSVQGVRRINNPLFGPVTGKVYTTSFETGRPSSKYFENQARNSGDMNYVISDTKVNETALVRASLNASVGFNMKAQLLPNSSFGYLSIKDMWDILNTWVGITPTHLDPTSGTEVGFGERPINKSQKIYLGIMSSTVKTIVKSTNKYLPIYVKVHFVKNVLETLDPAAVFESAWSANATQTLPSQRDTGTMPLASQLTGRPDTNDVLIQGAVSIGSKGFQQSDTWAQASKIVKTFKKKLNPGDTWEIYHKHNFGSGLDLDAFLAFSEHQANGDTIPISYYPIFEIAGSRTTLVSVSNKALMYDGTSPASALFEFRKTIRFAKPDGNLSQQSYSTSDQTYQVQNLRMSVRVFDDYINPGLATENEKLFHVPVSLMTDDPAVINAGTQGLYYIPLQTDVSTGYGGRND